jgi:hypothetical protein
VYSFIPSPNVPIHILHLGNIVNHVFRTFGRRRPPASRSDSLRRRFASLRAVPDEHVGRVTSEAHGCRRVGSEAPSTGNESGSAPACGERRTGR